MTKIRRSLTPRFVTALCWGVLVAVIVAAGLVL